MDVEKCPRCGKFLYKTTKPCVHDSKMTIRESLEIVKEKCSRLDTRPRYTYLTKAQYEAAENLGMNMSNFRLLEKIKTQ